MAVGGAAGNLDIALFHWGPQNDLHLQETVLQARHLRLRLFIFGLQVFRIAGPSSGSLSVRTGVSGVRHTGELLSAELGVSIWHPRLQITAITQT